MPQQSYRLFILPMLLAAVLAGVGYWGWRQLTKPQALPFKHIHVVAQEAHLQTSTLEKIAWDHLQGGFFTLKVDSLKQGLLAVPWVANVSLRRHWPSTLSITITEQQPVARWGQKGVMNTQGHVFYPALETIPKTLPILNGPSGEEKEILSKYQKLKDEVAALGLHIKNLNVSPRLSYQMVLSNGLYIVVGRQDVVERFHRFVTLYPQLVGQNNKQVIRVDLRYQNGIAIKRSKERFKKQ